MKQPEKEILQQWSTGELTGEQLSVVERWADANPDIAAAVMDELLEPILGFDTVGVVDDVPYPWFFNSKLEQQIVREFESETHAGEGVTPVSSGTWGKLKWLLAPTALVALVGSFFIGTQYGKVEQIVAKDNEAKHIIYLTNDKLSVDVIDTENASVIEVEGLEPFSDDAIPLSYNHSDEQEEMIVTLANQFEQQWF